MNEWPFDIWLKYAVKVLRLSPSEFWAMSICDWQILSAHEGGQALNRTTLESLMQSFPDKDEE